MNNNLKVIDIISACEFIGCDVFDQLENKIEITNENKNDIYSRSVESICAVGGKICIFTFDNIDKVSGINDRNMNDWVFCENETMIILTKAILDKIRKELDRCYRNKNQKDMSSPFDNSGAEPYSNDYLTIRSFYWGDDEDMIALPNFETQYVRVSWYKHSNRGVEVYFKYGFDSFSTLAVTLEKAIESIRKDFGEIKD